MHLNANNNTEYKTCTQILKKNHTIYQNFNPTAVTKQPATIIKTTETTSLSSTSYQHVRTVTQIDSAYDTSYDIH